MSPNPQETAHLVTLTEEILNEKNFIFLCSNILMMHHVICTIIHETIMNTHAMLAKP